MIQNKHIRDKWKAKKDKGLEFTNLMKAIFTQDSGSKIIIMAKAFLYTLMAKGTKAKWTKASEMEKAHFIIMMEEFIEDHGKMMKKMVMVLKKGLIIMKVNGKIVKKVVQE